MKLDISKKELNYIIFALEQLRDVFDALHEANRTEVLETLDRFSKTRELLSKTLDDEEKRQLARI